MFAVAGDIKEGYRKALLVVIFKNLPWAKVKLPHTRMQKFIATSIKIKPKTFLARLKCHLHNITSCSIKGEKNNNAI